MLRALPTRLARALPTRLPHAPPIRLPRAPEIRLPRAPPIRLPRALPTRLARAPEIRLPRAPPIRLPRAPADPVAAGAADQAGAGAADSVAAHPAGADSADTAGGNGVDNPGIADPDDTGGAGSVAAPSRRVAGGGGSQLDQFMPVVLFLVFYNLVNTEIAVLAATAWSVKAAYSRRRRGLPIGTWLPAITAYLLVRAVISIAVERELVDFGVSAEAVYFGIGIGTKMLVGLAAAATILVGRPLAVWAVRWVADLPDEVRSDRRFISTLRDVTWVIAFYEIGSSVWDIWLFNNSGVNVFLITRQVVNFAAAFALIFATLAYVDRRFSKIDGCPSLVEMVSRTTRRNPASGP